MIILGCFRFSFVILVIIGMFDLDFSLILKQGLMMALILLILIVLGLLIVVLLRLFEFFILRR